MYHPTKFSHNIRRIFNLFPLNASPRNLKYSQYKQYVFWFLQNVFVFVEIRLSAISISISVSCGIFGSVKAPRTAFVRV